MTSHVLKVYPSRKPCVAVVKKKQEGEVAVELVAQLNIFNNIEKFFKNVRWKSIYNKDGICIL
jgi:hypothetical protein